MSRNPPPINPRWFEVPAHSEQQRYWHSPHRFNVVAAGRRSLKTETFKRRLVRKALGATTPWAPRFFAGAPTRDQAKRIFWEDLKLLLGRDMMAKPPSETELKLTAITGAEIWVVGLDKPERIEGSPWDGGGITEFANTKPNAWTHNIRPALSDRKGWCDLEGVPEGRNHYYKHFLRASEEMAAQGDASEWGAFTWKSSEVLPPEEIEAARRDLDELTFQQEYEASFVNFEGRAYYVFDRATHCRELRYDPLQPLAFCFDFNVAPGVAAVVQEQVIPGQFEPEGRTREGIVVPRRPVTGTGVIGEVHIPRNSNTPAVCRRLAHDWKEHKGRVVCYGDATGGARGSAKVEGSDWELIEKELRPVFRDRLSFRVKEANPAERSRINAVNARLRSASGIVRMLVDPRRAPHVAEDLDGVVLLKGGSGEIDKKATPELTHLSDALGYYVEEEFPVQGAGLLKVRIAGH